MTAKTPIYPDYVPLHIQRQATLLRHGARAYSGDDGLAGALVRLHEKLSELEQYLEDAEWLSEEARSALHREKRDLSTQIKQAEDELDCLERLTARPDRDLEDIYTLVTKDIKNDEQVWAFIYAALSANVEFTRFRDALKSARERKQEIARLAQELAEELDELDRTGIQGPDVFWSIRSLLDATDAPENNFIVWRQMRGLVLGGHGTIDGGGANLPEVADEITADEYQDLPDDDFVVGEIEEGDPVAATPEQDRRYAWQVAPHLPDLLKTLSEVAANFEPREHHLIGAALNARQDSVKTSYVRAFAHLLNENEVSITPPIMRAMAKTATLVLDREDLVVSYDNVRKAL